MKKLIFLIIMFVFAVNVFAESLFIIHPLDFKWTKNEKVQVIKFIKDQVKKTYTEIGLGDPSTLRMMENKELRDFKALTQVKNRELLDDVIDSYCDPNVDMCNYSTIYMMYRKQLKSSKSTLTW